LIAQDQKPLAAAAFVRRRTVGETRLRGQRTSEVIDIDARLAQ
jgi:hypothetical protein